MLPVLLEVDEAPNSTGICDFPMEVVDFSILDDVVSVMVCCCCGRPGIGDEEASGGDSILPLFLLFINSLPKSILSGAIEVGGESGDFAGIWVFAFGIPEGAAEFIGAFGGTGGGETVVVDEAMGFRVFSMENDVEAG